MLPKDDIIMELRSPVGDARLYDTHRFISDMREGKQPTGNYQAWTLFGDIVTLPYEAKTLSQQLRAQGRMVRVFTRYAPGGKGYRQGKIPRCRDAAKEG